MKNLQLIPQYCREGRTYAAIAVLCGISPGAVSVAVAALRANGVDVPDTVRARALARIEVKRKTREYSRERSML